jgi:DNA-binding transcriptional regulator LsrR (DeoR family)
MTKPLTKLQSIIWKAYSEEGLNQYQIAERLGKSQSEISRALTGVRKKLGDIVYRYDKRTEFDLSEVKQPN